MKSYKKVICLIIAIAAICSVFVFTASAAGGSIAYGAATVRASALNIRSGPSTGYSRVGLIPNGAKVVVIERTSDSWYKINYDGTVGYACADYLVDVLTAENFNATGVINGTGVRMRSGPSTDYSIVDVFGYNDSVSVIGINNSWFKVNYGGNTGYVRSDFLNITSMSSVSSSSDSSSSSSSDSGSSYTPASSYDSATGSALVDFALQFEGYRYVYGAQSPSQGFDCSGFTYYVYGQFGYSISRTASQQYRNNGVSVDKSDLQPGDLVFFSDDGGASVTHVGLYIGGSSFIHASTSRTGVIISDLNSSYYTRVWYGAKRILV